MKLSIPTDATDCTIIGTGVPFERIRRITGYLVGTLDRFNNAKAAEGAAGDIAGIAGKCGSGTGTVP